MCDLLWDPSSVRDKLGCEQIYDNFDILAVNTPYLTDVDQKIYTYLLIGTDAHPGGMWALLHHLNPDIGRTYADQPTTQPI